MFVNILHRDFVEYAREHSRFLVLALPKLPKSPSKQERCRGCDKVLEVTVLTYLLHFSSSFTLFILLRLKININLAAITDEFKEFLSKFLRISEVILSADSLPTVALLSL